MTESVGAIGPGRRRERDTIDAMLRIFCHDRHRSKRTLCEECHGVLAYSERRLEKCLFEEDKPTCAQCPVHCYQPAMRAKVREVMRYAGPRLIYRHPILALLHMLHGRKAAPQHPRRREPVVSRCAAAPNPPPDRSTPDAP
jgi:hypothetical protein